MTKFLSKWRLLILVIAIAVAGVFVAVEPAEAGIVCDTTLVCGTIKHYSPDNGYDVSIIIRCDYNVASTKRYVAEGTSSRKWCRDTDQVYVRINEEIHCRYYDRNGRLYWVKQFDATGWHKITDNFNRSCVVGRD